MAGLGLVAVWGVLSFLFSASLWYHLFGKAFTYDFPEKAPTQYLIGLKQNTKAWSERQGRLDTPLETLQLDEMGNVLMDPKKADAKKQTSVVVSVKEWIQIFNTSTGSGSHTLPLNHPSLAGVRLVLDRKGTVIERRYALSPRLAKSLLFLAPKFPKGSLRRGRMWNESVEWLDVYNEWKIRWTGTLHWSLGEMEPCGTNTCAKLTYRADLHPQLYGSPAWAKDVVQRADATVATEGAALFDPYHKRLVSNTFSYEGLLHFPIAKLERIPWELRVGRGVRGPGEILLRFENKIEVRKN